MSAELNSLIASIQCVNHGRVRNDILSICTKYPGLRYRSTVHIHNDGSECLLIMLEGTIPITFKSVVYHIPIELLVSSSYPDSIPMCFVRPVKGMEVVHQHRFVNTDGKVFHPYLKNWSSLTSTLVGLADNLVEVFSQKPPVFSVQPRRSMPTTIKQRAVVDTHKESVDSSDPKKRALQRLVVSIKEQLRQIYASGRNETEVHYRLRGKLEKSMKRINTQIRELGEFQSGLAESLEEAKQANEDMDDWLKTRAEEEQAQGESAKDDEAIYMIPSDGQSMKLFDLVSESAAIEDTLYALDRAMMREAITLDEFMKHLRELSRQQFLCHTHIEKINKIQRDRKSNMVP